MDRKDLIDFSDDKESLKSGLNHIQELKVQITNITSIISDMPKRKQRSE